MNYHQTNFFRGLIIFVLCSLSFTNTTLAQQSPNIVFIMADDMGYGDLKAFNDESLVPTPNLDKFASESMRLTDAYCPVSVCSPTRYTLMTGQYSWRSWNKSGVMANYEPSMIDSSMLTLPEMLQDAGYTTAGFGKWHLGTSFPTLDGEKPAGYGKFRADNNGENLDLSKPVYDGPMDHGFDHWLGFSCASECWIFEDKMVMGAIGHDLYTIEATPNKDHIKTIPLEDYLPFITDSTVQFLQEYAEGSQEKPFFLYYAPYVPHIPLAVSQEFRGKTKAGLYGDYVHELDYYVGIVLDQLESLGMKENTIVLFASDNGSQFPGTSHEMDLTQASNSPEANKQSSLEEDVHHPNGPLRGTKWTAWEGGVRTPLIARWPGHFPAGEVSQELFALNDVMPSLAAAIGYKLPKEAAPDGYDLLPVLQNKAKGKRDRVVVQSSGNTLGLRWGKWKYIGAGDYKVKEGQPPGELYDLSTDISESVNLYEKYPEKAEEMKQMILDIMENGSPNKE